MEAEKDYTVKDDMICPITKLHCDDECCPVGSTCNMSNTDILNYESPSMENLQIKIVITDGEKEAKTSINIKDYQAMKELHGVSLVDMQVDALLNETFGGDDENSIEEKLYTKDEVLDLLVNMNSWPTTFEGREDITEWFEQGQYY